MTAASDQPYDLLALRAALEKSALIASDAGLKLIPYEAAYPRRLHHHRWHYRVESAGQPICHLIVGSNLARVYHRAEKFFQICPELICRPLLFWEQSNGADHFCLEHFAGESLEETVRQGRCSAAEWLEIVRRSQRFLERSETSSAQDALHREIRDLIQETCTFPGFSNVDVQLMRELAEPLLIQQASFLPLTTRWSNGDFIGRNLLINSQGDIRLIDYEYAGPTHFWRSDWLRLTQFSVLPPGLRPHSIEEVSRAHQPWQKVHLWLQNLSQLGQAEPCETVNRHIAAVIRELFKAIDFAAGGEPVDRSRSFLLTTLASGQADGASFVETPRDAKYREKKLTEDLAQANYRLSVTARELARQEATVRFEQGVQEKARLGEKADAIELERLRRELLHAQTHLDPLLILKDTRAASISLDSKSQENPATSTARILYGLDQEKELHAVHGELSLSGWIAGVNLNGCQIRLRLLGPDTIFKCVVEIPRPDVAAHSTAVEGSIMRFSLATYVPPGLHVGTFEYRTPSLRDWTCFCTRSFIADVSPLVLRLELPIPPTRPSGACKIEGWCFHPQDLIQSISVRHGATSAAISYGILRPDVGAAHLWNDAAQHCGFAGILELAPGTDDVVLIAVLRGGAILREVIARNICIPEEVVETATPILSETSNLGEPALCRLHETLQFGVEDTIRPFLEVGWKEPENTLRWAVGPKLSLRLRFNSRERPRQMTFSLIPLIVSGRADRQRLFIEHPPGTVPAFAELTKGELQEVVFNLPDSATSGGILHVQLGFPDACRPQDLGLSDDVRLLSVAFVSLRFS